MTRSHIYASWFTREEKSSNLEKEHKRYKKIDTLQIFSNINWSFLNNPKDQWQKDLQFWKCNSLTWWFHDLCWYTQSHFLSQKEPTTAENQTQCHFKEFLTSLHILWLSLPNWKSHYELRMKCAISKYGLQQNRCFMSALHILDVLGKLYVNWKKFCTRGPYAVNSDANES